MSYVNPKTGYPSEFANKVGHIKLIEDPFIQSLMESFESNMPSRAKLPAITGHIDLEEPCELTQVITVDGGQQAVPNVARPSRQLGFVQVAAQMVRLETLEYLESHPLADPRFVRKMLSQFTDHTLAAVPLAGVHMPNMSVRQSIRETIHRFFSRYQLYDALRFLVYREWLSTAAEVPEMDCLKCSRTVSLPRHAIEFSCPACGEGLRLGDYLLMTAEDGQEGGRLELVSSFRASIEVLALFSTIGKARNKPEIMNRTLFLLDGPLLLRAGLSRLVEPIRDFLAWQTEQGQNVYLAGVEKGGEVRAYADEVAETLKDPGDYVIVGFPFLVENISGRTFNPRTYRNRVNYGAKTIIRLSRDHVIVLNIPTGHFVLEPTSGQLLGFEQIGRFLSKVTSYRYDNALIPIVLINEDASISNTPSNGILKEFVDKVVDGH